MFKFEGIKGLRMKNSKPLVSIIMPFYNEEPYIGKAIESILNQTYTNIELICIDDYSTDNSCEIVNRYIGIDSRIRLYSKEFETRSAGVSRNIGIRMALGDFIAFQDADDQSAPTRIEKQLDFVLEKPNQRLVGCNVLIINKKFSKIQVLPENNDQIVRGFNKFFGRGNYFIMGTALGSKSIFTNNPSKEILRYVEDWDQLLRIYENENVELYNIQEPLYTYNQIGGLSTEKKGWIKSNLFVRFSQRMRNNNYDDPTTFKELNKYLYEKPNELILYMLLSGAYYLRLKLLK